MSKQTGGALIFAWVFATYAKQIQVLYFWDLTGAAVGCVVLIPLLPPVGPGGLLLIAAGLALVAGVLFVPWRRVSWVPLAGAAGLIAVPFLLPGYLEFVEHKSDRGLYFARLEGKSELVSWDPISKIEVIDLDIVKNIIYDGGSQSSFIYPFDGQYLELRNFLEESVRQNFEAGFLRHFWQRGVVASHRLKRGTAQRVLVIGQRRRPGNTSRARLRGMAGGRRGDGRKGHRAGEGRVSSLQRWSTESLSGQRCARRGPGVLAGGARAV